MFRDIMYNSAYIFVSIPSEVKYLQLAFICHRLRVSEGEGAILIVFSSLTTRWGKSNKANPWNKEEMANPPNTKNPLLCISFWFGFWAIYTLLSLGRLHCWRTANPRRYNSLCCSYFGIASQWNELLSHAFVEICC